MRHWSSAGLAGEVQAMYRDPPDGAPRRPRREAEVVGIDIEIRIAFVDVMRPPTLARRRRPEVDAMDRELGQRPWSDLGADDLLRHRAALALLDAAAFRYYLPAYLLASLDDSAPSFREELREVTLNALAPYSRARGPNPVDASLFQERVAALDQRQRGMIRRYVDYVRRQVADPRLFPALDPAGVWR